MTALITVKSGQTFYLLDATGEAIEAASVGAVRVEVWP